MNNTQHNSGKGPVHFLRRSLAAVLMLLAVPTLMSSTAGAKTLSANMKTFCSTGAALAAVLDRPLVPAKSILAATTLFTTLHNLAITIKTTAPSAALSTDFANLAASAQKVSKDANALKSATLANSLYQDSFTRRLGANLETAVDASSPVAQQCPSFLFESLKGSSPPSTTRGSDVVILDIGNQAVADANFDSLAPTLTTLEGSMKTLGYTGVTLQTYTLFGGTTTSTAPTTSTTTPTTKTTIAVGGTGTPYLATVIFIVATADYSRFKTCLAFHGPGKTPTICHLNERRSISR